MPILKMIDYHNAYSPRVQNIIICYVLQDELADCSVLVTFRATANKEVYKDKVVPPLDCSAKEGLKQVTSVNTKTL